MNYPIWQEECENSKGFAMGNNLLQFCSNIVYLYKIQ